MAAPVPRTPAQPGLPAARALHGLFAQKFIRRRSSTRWFAHFCFAWGTLIAVAVTFPLVFGWLHFETRPLRSELVPRGGAGERGERVPHALARALRDVQPAQPVGGDGHRGRQPRPAAPPARPGLAGAPAVRERHRAAPAAPRGLRHRAHADPEHAPAPWLRVRAPVPDPRLRGRGHAPVPAVRQALPRPPAAGTSGRGALPAGQRGLPAGRVPRLRRGLRGRDARLRPEGRAGRGRPRRGRCRERRRTTPKSAHAAVAACWASRRHAWERRPDGAAPRRHGHADRTLRPPPQRGASRRMGQRRRARAARQDALLLLRHSVRDRAEGAGQRGRRVRALGGVPRQPRDALPQGGQALPAGQPPRPPALTARAHARRLPRSGLAGGHGPRRAEHPAHPGKPRTRRLRPALRRFADQREGVPDGQARPGCAQDAQHRLQRPALHGLGGGGQPQGLRHRPRGQPLERHPAREVRDAWPGPTSESASPSSPTTSGARATTGRASSSSIRA